MTALVGPVTGVEIAMLLERQEVVPDHVLQAFGLERGRLQTASSVGGLVAGLRAERSDGLADGYDALHAALAAVLPTARASYCLTSVVGDRDVDLVVVGDDTTSVETVIDGRRAAMAVHVDVPLERLLRERIAAASDDRPTLVRRVDDSGIRWFGMFEGKLATRAGEASEWSALSEQGTSDTLARHVLSGE